MSERSGGQPVDSLFSAVKQGIKPLKSLRQVAMRMEKLVKVTQITSSWLDFLKLLRFLRWRLHLALSNILEQKDLSTLLIGYLTGRTCSYE